jgi:hypothetical protein
LKTFIKKVPLQNRKGSSSLKINSKSTLLHALRTVGDGVANNLNDASHLPHFAESFFILCCTSCELTEGSSRRKYTFTSSIRRALSRPGIVRTRKRAESGEMCEI